MTTKINIDKNTFFGKLCYACQDKWTAYIQHEFIQKIGDGSLPNACFQRYLVQDYLYLIQLARAWALVVYKSDELENMRSAVSVLHNLLHKEIELHVDYCTSWGISQTELSNAIEEKNTLAYSRYILDCGLSGDILDLYVALTPCNVGYVVIAQNLMNVERQRLLWTRQEKFSKTFLGCSDNPYLPWIEMYANKVNRQIAEQSIQNLEHFANLRMNDKRLPQLVKIFGQALEFEIGFWEIGLLS
ncbi:MAG: hypothetical protein B6242_02940 [Anaerolineaceae bacterium 4572_78]|nr:MAG: hypothetical protein B6242_02940 [Anaerolineaceae bacterium 4572_78]